MSKLIAIDFETQGLTPWAKDFELVSIGLAWRDDTGQMATYFAKGFENIEAVIARLSETQDKILVYNQSFEMRIIQYYWPHLPLAWFCDVQRLVQLAGYSFDKGSMTIDVEGFALKPAITRILGKVPQGAEIIYKWIHDTHKVTKNKAGQYLATAPDDILEQYNLEDSIYTIELYEFLTTFFARTKFDWTIDQELYQGVVKELVTANLEGISVNRVAVKRYIGDIETEIAEMDANFLTTYAEPITRVREKLRVKEQAKFKKKIVTEAPEFNTGSRQHLEMLFCGELGLSPTFFSPTGSPSFKSTHMETYGEAGEMLALRGKRQIIMKQAEALLKVSSADGLWHPELKACGTTTGRFAGSSGLNVQGISRGDKRLMELFQAPPGMRFVEIDAVSGEPTLTTAYSNDAVYRYQVFDGVGKAPFYNDDGLLMIDDTYIALMSVSGQGSKELKDVFYNEKFNGLSFAEQWLVDPEVVKGHKVVKKWRKINKMLSLALAYGMGAKKLVKQMKDMYGVHIEDNDAKRIVKNYWKMYSGVKAFSEKCARRLENTGYLINQFGFRITTEPRKGFNGLIQSTLSGVVNWKLLLMRKRCDYFKLVTIIHDSIIVLIPEEKVEEFRAISQDAVKEINAGLQFSVDVRFGFNVGRDFYEIK